ncbi:hypothetical protein C2845_PM07G14890 [Panicum miliaceum]|uniref:F-box protein AT5G49610-like beta-propeller domain-containing protein n=1 Tax=Panicum miliaceum TaxID=4540 RepID=A0A3L6SLT0_PANMI|nr:hypothetical protein C2845_PM07G14890 [Panicum miliaceum]
MGSRPSLTHGLATLVRAALTCRAWRRAVASSPSFRRRFRAVHPPPLLGLFFEAPGPVQTPNTPAFPTFVPARRRDRDLTAAVRGGDFFLTSLEDLPDEGPCWYIVDRCRGCVLLVNWDDDSLVVFNPLTRQIEDVFDLGPEDMFDDSRGHYAQLNPRLLFSDEDPTSFRVVLLVHDECRIRATVFSPDTWEWLVLPWVDVPASSGDDVCWIQQEDGMQANGFLYWVYEDKRYLVSLDTATMEFCVTELPHCLRDSTFDIGETKDGATCIVYSDQLNVGVLMHTRDDDGVEKWVLDRVVPLDRELERVLRVGLDDGTVLNNLVADHNDLSVLAVQDGYVYLLSISSMHNDPQTPCWFLSLCLESMRLERLFRRSFDNAVHPYIMAWPPSLVGNYGGFALQDAPSH